MTDSDKRQYPRYALPDIKVGLDGGEYELLDVSSEGVFVGGVDGGYAAGQAIELTLRVPLMNKVSPLVVPAVVVRQAEKGLAVQYATPNRTWPQVLRVLDMKQN